MKIEMIGKRFGRWLVIGEAIRDKPGKVKWKCRCDCGAIKFIDGYSLRHGSSKSCGCLLPSRQKGNKNIFWKGGRGVNGQGYVILYNPEHKRAMSNGYVREHIVLAEKAFGMELPVNTEIHHYGDVSDNSKLVICEDRKYHRLLHIRQQALETCGDVNKRRCTYCQEYDFVENLYVKHRICGGWHVYHRKCVSEYDKKRRLGNKQC